MILLLIWLVCAVAASVIAASKGRSRFGWLLIGALLGPFAVLGAAIVGRDTARDTRDGLRFGDLRPCPACHEAIRREASKCRHCSSPVEPLPERMSPLEMLFNKIADHVERRNSQRPD